MTREILHRTADDSRRVPWRNGRGVTEELALWPERASFERGDCAWRISKARVEEPGPFSVFAEHERTIVVTQGAGLVLSHGDAAPRARVRALEPYRFDGSWPTTADLVSGPVADFNVFTLRGTSRADVEVVRLGARRTRASVGPGHAFVHALAGGATVRVPREEEPIELSPGESAWLRELPTEEELEVAGESASTVVLLVRIESTR